MSLSKLIFDISNWLSECTGKIRGGQNRLRKDVFKPTGVAKTYLHRSEYDGLLLENSVTRPSVPLLGQGQFCKSLFYLHLEY